MKPQARLQAVEFCEPPTSAPSGDVTTQLNVQVDLLKILSDSISHLAVQLERVTKDVPATPEPNKQTVDPIRCAMAQQLLDRNNEIRDCFVRIQAILNSLDL